MFDSEDLDEMILEIEKLKSYVKGLEASNKELRMWRERFLNSQKLPQNPEKGAKVWCSFCGLNSIEMMDETPEKIIKILLDLHK